MSKDAVYYSTNPLKTDEQQLHKEAVGRDSTASNTIDAEKNDELWERLALARMINSAAQAIQFTYDNPEFNAYDNFATSKQWQKFSDPLYTKAYEMRGSTLLQDPKDGTLYVPKQDKDGNTTYFKVTEQGLVDAPDIDPLWMQRITRETGPNGEIQLYANGRKLDQQETNEIITTLKEHREDIVTVTHTQSDMEKSQAPALTVQKAEDMQWKAEMSSNTAEEKLSQSYTNDNFINRERAAIELKIANAELSQLSGTPDEAKEAVKVAQEMRDNLKKMEELKTQIAGKSPEEASKIMAAAFGDKYDIHLAQQTAAQQQLNAAAPPEATAPQTSARSIDTRSGLQTKIDLNGSFTSAANGTGATDPAQKPAPAAPAYKQQQMQM